MDDLTNLDFSSLITGTWIATIVSIVLGIASIVACIYLAKRKGHNVVNAFSAGCVFGPFAVIYYLFASEPKIKQSELDLRSDARQRSANLTTQTPSPLPAAPPAPPVPIAPLPPVRCADCGNVNPGEAQWCLGCGLKLHFDPVARVTLDTDSLRQATYATTRRMILAITGLLLFIALVVLLVTKL